MEILSTYTDTYRKANDIPDSDAITGIEVPKEIEGRDSEREELLMFPSHSHPQHQDTHHLPKKIDRYYFCTYNNLQKLTTQYYEFLPDIGTLTRTPCAKSGTRLAPLARELFQ